MPSRWQVGLTKPVRAQHVLPSANKYNLKAFKVGRPQASDVYLCADDSSCHHNRGMAAPRSHLRSSCLGQLAAQ